MEPFEMQTHRELAAKAETMAGSYNNQKATRENAVHAYQAVIYNLRKDGLDYFLVDLFYKVKRAARDTKEWGSLIKQIWNIYDGICEEAKEEPDPFYAMSTEHI